MAFVWLRMDAIKHATMKSVILLLALSSVATFAQPRIVSTNAVLVTTNVVTAHPAFRLVKGQLYNTELSTNFATIEGNCVAVLTNGIVVQRMEVQQIYQEVPTNTLQAATGVAPPAVLIREERVPGKKFFIRNYPDHPLATVGDSVSARAMRDGVFSHQSEVMELWEYGKPHKVTVVSTNGVPTNFPPRTAVSKPRY
jgi:hypothetical protein